MAATLDGRLRRRGSRHRPAVGVGGLALWCGHPACPYRPSSVHRADATPASECTFHQNPSVPNQNRRDGLAGWGPPNLPCPVLRSQSSTSMKDTRPWKLYTPPGMCGDVIYVCHSISQTDRDNAQLAAVDIKAPADVDTTSRCVLPHSC